MTLNDRLEQWKKTSLTENHEIDLALFKKIVKKAKRIENRTFGFKLSKSTILKNLRYAKIVAFNGLRAFQYGDCACYRLSKGIGIEGGEESITLYIQL